MSTEDRTPVPVIHSTKTARPTDTIVPIKTTPGYRNRIEMDWKGGVIIGLTTLGIGVLMTVLVLMTLIVFRYCLCASTCKQYARSKRVRFDRETTRVRRETTSLETLPIIRLINEINDEDV